MVCSGMEARDLRRFVAKIFIDGDGCWEWTACRNDGGYGTFLLGRVRRRAHQVAYEHWHGPRGKLHVMHSCDVRHCVNPAHLSLGTQLQNNRDMYAKGRGYDRRGSACGMAKADRAKVERIRTARAAGALLREIAEVEAMSVSQVWAIATRRSWNHDQD